MSLEDDAHGAFSSQGEFSQDFDTEAAWIGGYMAGLKAVAGELSEPVFPPDERISWVEVQIDTDYYKALKELE